MTNEDALKMVRECLAWEGDEDAPNERDRVRLTDWEINYLDDILIQAKVHPHDLLLTERQKAKVEQIWQKLFNQGSS